MKKLIYIIFGILVISAVSCDIDDFEDANPPRLLDGPAATEAVIQSDVMVSGGTVLVIVTIVDAPAGIDSASVLATDALGVDRGGSALLILGDGTTKGDVTVEYTSPAGFSGALTLSVRVWDAQVDDKGKPAEKGSDPLDVDVTVLCGDLAGTYDGTGTMLVDDFGSGPYNYVENVTLEACDTEGTYLVSDLSGGLYTNSYADAYGTSARFAVITIDGNNDITWATVSDQFGGEIIQDPAQPMSSYDPGTNTFTMYWTATAFGERGITELALQ
jgi:hypothetical protein